MELQRLVESFSKDWTIKRSLIKPLKLKESNSKILIEGKEYSPVKGYKVPVWKLDRKNLNGRIYPSELAEKLIKENKVTLSLKDHPKDDDDGSVDNIVAVGKNPSIEQVDGEPVLFAECYFVDEDFAKKAEKLIELDAGLGLSSSGLGEVDDDNRVIPETYLLERYFDYVLDPSYSVFLTKENAIIGDTNKEPTKLENVNESTLKESILKEKTLVFKTYNDFQDWLNKEKPNYTDKSNKIEVENIIYNSPIDVLHAFEESILKIEDIMKNLKEYSLEQKNFIISMSKFIEEADSIKEIEEKIGKFKELSSWCEEDFAKPIKEQIENKLSDLKKQFDELAVKGKKTDSLIEETNKLKEQIKEKDLKIEEMTKINNDLYEKFDELKIYANELSSRNKSYKKEIKEKVDTKDVDSLVKYIEELEKDNDELSKENLEIKKENEEMQNEFGNILAQKESNQKQLEALIQNNKQKKQVESKKKLEEIKKLEEKLEKEQENKVNFSLYKEEVIDLYEDWIKQDSRIEKYKEEILSCRNIAEAQSKKLKINSLLGDDYYESLNKRYTISNESRTPLKENWGLKESSIKEEDVFVIPNGME